VINEMQVHFGRMFVGAIRDISERKQDERIRKEFIATINHELHTMKKFIRALRQAVSSQSINVNSM
jgi:signal transduction histidine kinase